MSPGFLPQHPLRNLSRCPDLSAFDGPTGDRFGFDGPPTEEHLAVVASLDRLRDQLRAVPRRRQMAFMRRYIDELFPSDALPARFTPGTLNGVAGEWVTTPESDPSRRMLYIHGGGFMMGSPRSHRRLTSALADIIGGTVFAPDYRLMPEHPREAGIVDCQNAYRALLASGPDSAAPMARIWVAGDSAGGNLALVLAAWIRDQGLPMPDGVVAFSPLTDSSLASPSLRTKVSSDPMLGPLFGQLTRLPTRVLRWMSWWQNRIQPCDPRVSPVHGDLSRLPPTLIQVSDAEMLRDDARRYANRARTAGSPVRLQTWQHMVHVWQIFHPELAEGRMALEEVSKFIAAS